MTDQGLDCLMSCRSPFCFFFWGAHCDNYSDFVARSIETSGVLPCSTEKAMAKLEAIRAARSPYDRNRATIEGK